MRTCGALAFRSSSSWILARDGCHYPLRTPSFMAKATCQKSRQRLANALRASELLPGSTRATEWREKK
eukprot:6212510-Pleurochrysis_carterae.AAC.1